MEDKNNFIENIIDKTATKVSDKIIEKTEPIFDNILYMIFDIISVMLLGLIIYALYALITRKRQVKVPFLGESETISLIYFSSITYIIMRLCIAVVI